MKNGDKSTKYVTVYPYDASVDKTDADLNAASNANYLLNTKIFGDAIRETSISGINTTLWNKDYSRFPGVSNPFLGREVVLGII